MQNIKDKTHTSYRKFDYASAVQSSVMDNSSDNNRLEEFYRSFLIVVFWVV